MVEDDEIALGCDIESLITENEISFDIEVDKFGTSVHDNLLENVRMDSEEYLDEDFNESSSKPTSSSLVSATVYSSSTLASIISNKRIRLPNTTIGAVRKGKYSV